MKLELPDGACQVLNGHSCRLREMPSVIHHRRLFPRDSPLRNVARRGRVQQLAPDPHFSSWEEVCLQPPLRRAYCALVFSDCLKASVVSVEPFLASKLRRVSQRERTASQTARGHTGRSAWASQAGVRLVWGGTVPNACAMRPSYWLVLRWQLWGWDGRVVEAVRQAW